MRTSPVKGVYKRLSTDRKTQANIATQPQERGDSKVGDRSLQGTYYGFCDRTPIWWAHPAGGFQITHHGVFVVLACRDYLVGLQSLFLRGQPRAAAKASL